MRTHIRREPCYPHHYFRQPHNHFGKSTEIAVEHRDSLPLSAVRVANGQAACLWLQAGDYKVIEGLYGHQVGLELMELVEARLSGCLREKDFLCRLTSNEFMIVLTNLKDSDDAVRIADRLLDHGSGVYRTAGCGLHVQCSAGATLFPIDAAEPYQMLLMPAWLCPSPVRNSRASVSSSPRCCWPGSATGNG